MTIVGVSFDVDFAIDNTSRSRRAAFWALGKRIANLRTGSTSDEIATYFMLREQLGSVAIGHGVAVPQAVFPMRKIPLLHVARLTQPVDFGALDGAFVDLIFAIVGDRRDQRQMRSAIDRCKLIAGSPDLLHEIRTAHSRDEIICILTAAKMAGVHSQTSKLVGVGE